MPTLNKNQQQYKELYEQLQQGLNKLTDNQIIEILKVMIDSVVYQAHQLAWFYHYGYFPKGQIDHINHNKSDNRICNLREVSEKDNHKNRPKQVNNTSGCTGVSWYKLTNKWIAHIQVNKKHITLGYFNTFTEAVRTRKEAEVKYGFYKNHGRGVI